MAELEMRVKVHGARRIASKYRRAARRHPSFVDPPVKEWCQEQTRLLAVEPYPPERAGQTYVRTYTLPTGWVVERIKEMSYAVANTVEYAHWVVSKKYQAWMHRGRWWTAEDKMKANRKKLTKAIMDEIKDMLD
jgi:hypothetical protein